MDESRPVLLSIDDEPGVLKALKRSLRKLDLEVLTTTSDQEALEWLQKRTVDVVVSDMRMPGMMGPEFLKHAAELQPSASRIVLTGYADLEDTRAVINNTGVSAYLVKPWDDDELRRIVQNAIRMAGLTRENKRLTTVTVDQNEELRRLNAGLEELVNARTSELASALKELQENHQHMIRLVASIAALPQQETQNARTKVLLAVALAERLNFEQKDLRVIEDAAQLLRLGYVGLPHRVRAVALAKQTSEQREIFEHHPVYADAVLMNMDSMAAVRQLLRSQHENFDGSGYPDGLAGEAIPLGARVLAVSRDYVDFLSGRLNGESGSSHGALAHLRTGAGTIYDPSVVELLPEALGALSGDEFSGRETQVQTHALEVGMRLSRDLSTPDGLLLLAGDTALTDATIRTLIGLEKRSGSKLEIYVFEN